MGEEIRDTPTLGTQLPAEIARVRDQVLPAYLSIGVAGTYAVMMIRRDLDAASRAMIEGDVVEMLKCYKDLKGFET